MCACDLRRVQVRSVRGRGMSAPGARGRLALERTAGAKAPGRTAAVSRLVPRGKCGRTRSVRRGADRCWEPGGSAPPAPVRSDWEPRGLPALTPVSTGSWAAVQGAAHSGDVRGRGPARRPAVAVGARPASARHVEGGPTDLGREQSPCWSPNGEGQELLPAELGRSQQRQIQERKGPERVAGSGHLCLRRGSLQG